MKKIAILLAVIFIEMNAVAQETKTFSQFQVEIKGNGTPVLLIPGLSCSGDVWQETVDVLKENYQCHIFTLAGFAGIKPMQNEAEFLPVVKEALIRYIQEDLKERPIVIGHSLGGFLVLSMALKHDDLFEKIIIVDSYPFLSAIYNPAATEDNVLPQASAMKQILLQTPDSLYVQQQAMSLSTMITEETKVKLALRWSIESDRKTVSQAMYELMTTDLREKIASVKTPLLVLGSWIGGKDYGITKEVTLKQFKSQYALAQNVTVLVADTAKHFIMWDDFDWFIEKTKAFINEY